MTDLDKTIKQIFEKEQKRIKQEEENKDIELLATYAHNAWAGWMNYMFSLSTINENGECVIPKELFDRWDRQRRTQYSLLPENEKKSDREEARKILAILNRE